MVPRIRDGILQYAVMEFVAPSAPGDGWTLRDKSIRPAPSLPVTSATPRTASLVSAAF